VIKRFASLTLLLVLFAVSVAAQDSGPVRCVVTMYRLNGDRWKLTKALEFTPKLGEEELTNKRVRLPGSRLTLIASTFPTDESLGSARGADSLKLGLAMSRRFGSNAFDLPNNAVAEVTLSTLDTARVERMAFVAGRPMLTRLECWDSELEKKLGSGGSAESAKY
jgi:hypothetical protein